MTKSIENVDDLILDPNNANKGTQQGQTIIRKSIAELGAGRSILVDRNGVVIAGNKSLAMAKEIGVTNVEVVCTTGDKLVVVQRTDLDMDEPNARLMAIADNRASEVDLEWDPIVLKNEAEDIDIDWLFTDEQIASLATEDLNDTEDLDAPEEFKEFDETLDTDHECPKCGYKWSGKK